MKFRMPPGFRFNPSDQELLLYLKMKAKGVAFLPWKEVVIEKNLYSQNAVPWMLFTDDDPWQITTKVDAAAGKMNVEKNLYVVTKLVKIGNKRTVRSVGSWTWGGATGKTNILNHRGQIMGFKRMLNLRGKGMEIVGNWIMHEYHLSGVSLQELEKENDYVICRIKWDYSESMKSSKVQEIEETGDQFGMSDELGKLGKRKAVSDQEFPVGKRVCSRDSNNSSLVINEGNVMAEGSLISVTEVQERDSCYETACELEHLSKEKSRFDQESPIGTEFSCSGSINHSEVNVADSDCSCGGIGNVNGELDTIQLVQEDDLNINLDDIINLDDLGSFEGLF